MRVSLSNLYRNAIVALTAAVLAVPALTQATLEPLAAPVPPIMVSYRFVPDYFVQWITANQQYSTIEAYLNASGARPQVEVVLTTRADHKRIAYANSDELVQQAK